MKFTAIEDLLPGMKLGRDIQSPVVSFSLKKGVFLTDDDIAHLKEKGYLGAYIFEPWTEDITVDAPISQRTFNEAVKAVGDVDVDRLLGSAAAIVKDVSSMKSPYIDLMDLRCYEDYTLRHSVNVAVFAVLVAKYMGFSDEDLLNTAIAGICHDLGKLKISPDIINKPGRLTDEEFEEIKKHPKYSFDALYGKTEVSATIRQAILCHHENENGSGYPLGKKGKEIPVMAKILHAVDVYDALISKRPYKQPHTPAEAFEYLTGGRWILFDHEVVNAMRNVIPTYPVATDVYLSTGEIAVVKAQTEDPLRPVVRILGSGTDINLSDVRYMDILIESTGFAATEHKGVQELNENRLKEPLEPRKIMLVDESVVALQATKSALSKGNYKLITLQSGFAAIKYIKEKGAPNLIIIDVDMETMDGMTAVTKIREMGFKGIPVIFLTANTRESIVKKCIALGAKDFIVKPALPVYLQERVAVALDASLER